MIIKKYVFLCNEEFCVDKTKKKKSTKQDVKLDHCHFTGKYRGAAHSKCNLKYKVPKNIPVAFHNGSSYDNHFVIKQLAKDFNGYFNCISENTEKYITFSVTVLKERGIADKNKKKKFDAYTLKFIDSYQFMAASLEKHVKNLAKLGKNIPINVIQERFYNTYQICNKNIEKFKLILRKGVYLYEYMDSWKEFNEPVSLDKKYYYSKSNDENISDSDIEHVKNVCHTFKK